MTSNPIRSSVLAVLLLPLLTSCALFTNRAAEEEKARIYMQASVDQLGERQYTKAQESVFESLKYQPNSASAYNQLALIFMETKRYEKSEEAFKKALDLRPDYPEVFNNLGVLLNRQERYREAIGYFEKALTYEKYGTPENPLTNLGFAYFKMGNYSRAKAYHQKALDVMPQSCLANKNMGDVYAKEKKYKQAVDYFEKSSTHCPLYQEAQYKLALALVKVGNKNVARTQLERLIQKHRSGPYVERSNEVLKYLH